MDCCGWGGKIVTIEANGNYTNVVAMNKQNSNVGGKSCEDRADIDDADG